MTCDRLRETGVSIYNSKLYSTIPNPGGVKGYNPEAHPLSMLACRAASVTVTGDPSRELRVTAALHTAVGGGMVATVTAVWQALPPARSIPINLLWFTLKTNTCAQHFPCFHIGMDLVEKMLSWWNGLSRRKGLALDQGGVRYAGVNP